MQQYIDNFLDEENIRKLNELLDKYNVSKAVLFGSYARGSQSRHSDIDLMIVQKTERRYLDRYEGIFSQLMNIFKGHAVDLLIYTPEELEKILHRKFIQKILEEGITIYEQRTTAL